MRRLSLDVSMAMISMNLVLISGSSAAPSWRVSMKPEIEVRGVFSSWLTLATNSFLMASAFLLSSMAFSISDNFSE